MDVLLDAETHDLRLIGRDLALTDGVGAVAQRIKQRLLTIQGEWFLDETVGLPWFASILTKGSEPTTVKQLLVREIAETPGVVELQALEVVLEPVTRRMRCQFTALVTGGESLTLEVVG